MVSAGVANKRTMRLDEALVVRGLAETRSRARALILARDVLLNGQPVTKAGALVREGDELILKAAPRFVSRGGEKLDHALDVCGIDVAGRVAADFGASTGGFTDVLLQRGAAKVYAIDVGYGQLAERLRHDPRVVVMDRTNVRTVESLPEQIDIVTIDVSFIGLHLVLPTAKVLVGPSGDIVALIKPQFEAGRADVGHGGVVRDPAVHRRVLEAFVQTAEQLGLGVRAMIASPLRGPAGNIEFLAHLVPNAPSVPSNELIDHALAGAAQL